MSEHLKKMNEHLKTAKCYSPPDITSLRKQRGANNFWGHPGIRPSGAHFCCVVRFPGQAKISDF